MKKILLTKGKYATVDNEDYSYLNRFKWRVSEQYVMSGKVIRGAVRQVILQRYSNKKSVIFDYPLEYCIIPQRINRIVMHKDGDWLNFQKNNLIYGTVNLSKHRSGKMQNTTSIYKGVSRESRCLKIHPWSGRISKRIDNSGKRIDIKKYFPTEKEAAIWYNKKAKELYGEFAYQNIIE